MKQVIGWYCDNARRKSDTKTLTDINYLIRKDT